MGDLIPQTPWREYDTKNEPKKLINNNFLYNILSNDTNDEVKTVVELLAEKEYKENPDNWTAKEKQNNHDDEITRQEKILQENFAVIVENQREILLELRSIAVSLESIDKNTLQDHDLQ